MGDGSSARAERLGALLLEIHALMDQLTERIVEARELASTSDLFGSEYDELKEFVNTARMDLWFIGVCIEGEEYLEHLPEKYLARLGDEYQALKNRMRAGKLR
jgi:hypothetical protein